MTEVGKKRAPMNAGLVEAAVRRHVDYRANILIPEAEIWWSKAGVRQGTYRADFMTITKAGYGTELEVKVSRADWKTDLTKSKWQGMPPWVTRFIYVVPAELGIPDFVPRAAGVWHVSSRVEYLDGGAGVLSDGLQIQVARAPHVLGREKVPQAVINKWMGQFYYRYWDRRVHDEHRIPKSIREGAV